MSRTLAFGPGRKLARMRYATLPSLRSRLAGWTWSAVISGAALISPPAISDLSAWEGRMPVRVNEPFTGRGSARGRSGRPSNSLSRSIGCSIGHCLGIRRGASHPYLGLLPGLDMLSLSFQSVRRKGNAYVTLFPSTRRLATISKLCAFVHKCSGAVYPPPHLPPIAPRDIPAARVIPCRTHTASKRIKGGIR